MTPDIVPSSLSYQLSDLCVLANVPARSERFYVEIGLVDHLKGGTRAARSGPVHLEQLLLIKKWTTAGLSLERIGDLLRGLTPRVPLRSRSIRSVEVRSHLMEAKGVDVVIEPGRAGLTSEKVCQFIKGVIAVFFRLAVQRQHQPMKG